MHPTPRQKVKTIHVVFPAKFLAFFIPLCIHTNHAVMQFVVSLGAL